MAGTEFYKMTGSGNDFILLDGRTYDPSVWSPDLIARVCARRTGAGADGMIFILPGTVEDSVEFVFFNSDGSRAPMCGNGALCAARLAGELGMAAREGMVLQTDAGDYRTWWANDDGSRISIGLDDAVPGALEGIDLEDGERSIHFLRVGGPHVVVVVDDIEAVDLERRGREIRYHPSVAPEGSNVNFVSGGPETGWFVRTYERGVEAETLACGTGSVACTAVLASTEALKPPISVTTRSKCSLTVEGTPGSGEAPQLTDPILTGNAEIVYLGVLGLV